MRGARSAAIPVVDAALLAISAWLAWCVLTSWAGFVARATERGERVSPWSRQEMGLLARESAARAVLGILHPLGWVDRRPAATAGTTSDVPVLIVPDHRRNGASLTFLAMFLRHRGWSWVWPVSYRRHDLRIADQAAHLSTQVETLLRATHARQVDIIGHGLGGLVGAWYVRHLDGAPKVRRLVTVSTPWSGTRTAVFAREPLATETAPGAVALDGLAPPAVPTVAIWSPDDSAVVPGHAGAPTGVDAIRLEAMGHVEALLSARVYRAVQAALTQGAVPNGALEAR